MNELHQINRLVDSVLTHAEKQGLSQAEINRLWKIRESLVFGLWDLVGDERYGTPPVWDSSRKQR